MSTSTYIAKAIEATKGKTIKQLRGFFDQASKNVIADQQILARIVRECVWEARRFSVEQLEQFIPADVNIAATPVFRDDAAVEDPGPVRQDNTEDGSIMVTSTARANLQESSPRRKYYGSPKIFNMRQAAVRLSQALHFVSILSQAKQRGHRHRRGLRADERSHAVYAD